MDWQVFLLTFGTVFISELGDKSQLVTFSLSGTVSAPRYVFVGASLALLLSSFLGAVLGDQVAIFLPTKIIKLLAALIFAVMALRSLMASD
ncbi:MAG: TMEM165/GDT1 family protein [Pseudanabaenaceae cyanobacterium]